MKNTSNLEEKLRKYGKKNILIVDTKKNYKLEQVLNKIGYSATMVTSEKEALQTFFDTPFDIILSEIFFGGGDFSVETFYDLIPKLKVIDEKALFMGMTNEKKNISRMGDKDIISSSLYPQYIVTDGNKLVQKNKTSSLGIESYFKKIFYTHAYGIHNRKPSTYCFEKIKKIEKCAWNQMIYIGV